MPATNGGKKCSNSWRPRKYQGALAGLGVSSGLASCSSGASQKSATITIAMTSTWNAMASRISRCGKVINCGPRSPTTFADVFLVTKTTRRGSFFASELNPVSILFFSIFVLGLDGQAAVFLHPPEMNADQHECRERKNHDVKHVEAQQRVFPDDVSTKKEETHF